MWKIKNVIEMQYTQGSRHTFHCLSNVVGSLKLIPLDSSKPGLGFPECPHFPTQNPSLHLLSEELRKCPRLLGSHLLILKQDRGIGPGTWMGSQEQISTKPGWVTVTSEFRLPWLLPFLQEMECSGTCLLPHSWCDS